MNSDLIESMRTSSGFCMEQGVHQRRATSELDTYLGICGMHTEAGF